MLTGLWLAPLKPVSIPSFLPRRTGSYSSQGKTMSAVMLDLNVEGRDNMKALCVFATVIFTRVRCRKDVLTLRPFGETFFQQRWAAEGPQLLLRKLRGEHVDWDAYRQARFPSRPCAQCKQLRISQQ
eukprot:1669190-Amphidinium_carterae.2